MNASQIHLALTHVPVILCLTGMIMLGTSFILKKTTLRQTALYILIIAAIASFPVFFSGEGAEEITEKLPGVNEITIERHESIAKLAFAVIIVTGLVALVGVMKFMNATILKNTAWLSMLLTIVATVLMIQAAHLGGQIRHTEIVQATNATENQNQDKEEDDD